MKLPGDLPREHEIARMIWVDHAGEYGAARIYAGQLAVLSGTPQEGVLRHMADQEQHHLERFQELLIRRRVRPTALMPFWHVAGFALGAATATLGPRAAMACTVAVEEAIDRHYSAQADVLMRQRPSCGTRSRRSAPRNWSIAISVWSRAEQTPVSAVEGSDYGVGVGVAIALERAGSSAPLHPIRPRSCVRRLSARSAHPYLRATSRVRRIASRDLALSLI